MAWHGRNWWHTPKTSGCLSFCETGICCVNPRILPKSKKQEWAKKRQKSLNITKSKNMVLQMSAVREESYEGSVSFQHFLFSAKVSPALGPQRHNCHPSSFLHRRQHTLQEESGALETDFWIPTLTPPLTLQVPKQVLATLALFLSFFFFPIYKMRPKALWFIHCLIC